jgi:hypothetical protein
MVTLAVFCYCVICGIQALSAVVAPSENTVHTGKIIVIIPESFLITMISLALVFISTNLEFKYPGLSDYNPLENTCFMRNLLTDKLISYIFIDDIDTESSI